MQTSDSSSPTAAASLSRRRPDPCLLGAELARAVRRRTLAGGPCGGRMPKWIRSTRRRPPGPALPPARRADVPAFLERLYGVTVAASELQVLGGASELQMLGLSAAHAAASKRSIDRGAPAAVARAL